jgi:hypothetical protein
LNHDLDINFDGDERYIMIMVLYHGYLVDILVVVIDVGSFTNICPIFTAYFMLKILIYSNTPN